VSDTKLVSRCAVFLVRIVTRLMKLASRVAIPFARKDWFGAFVFIILFGFLLTIVSPYFFTMRNLSNILVQSAVVALLAGGQTFVILTGGIDLSVAAVTALSGTLAGHLMVAGLHPLWGIALALGIGLFIGLFNGVLVAKLHMPAFIVTLGGLSLWRGIAFEAVGGWDVNGMPPLISFLGGGRVLNVIPMPIVILVIYYACAHFILRHTRLGVYTYAIGSNASATRNAGIRVDRFRMMVYVISSLSAALAGIVLIGRLDSAGGKIATDFELLAIASVILGGTSLFGGRGIVWGTLLGALLINMIRNGLNLLGMSSFWQLIATGAIIIIAVLFDVLRKRRISHEI